MARLSVRSAAVGAVGVVAGGTFLLLHPPGPHDGPVPQAVVVANVAGASAPDDSIKEFTVTAGTATGLYPGAVVPLRLTVVNPYSFDIAVSDLAATVVATSDARCSAVATNITVRAYQAPPALPLVVGPKTQRTAGTVPLVMPNTVADACQGVTFTLRLSATATKAKK